MSCFPSSIVVSQRSAISRLASTAPGMSANDSAISSGLLRKNSFVEKLIFGWASVDLVCTHSSAAWC
jgi:hypothetical protein